MWLWHLHGETWANHKLAEACHGPSCEISSSTNCHQFLWKIQVWSPSNVTSFAAAAETLVKRQEMNSAAKQKTVWGHELKMLKLLSIWYNVSWHVKCNSMIAFRYLLQVIPGGMSMFVNVKVQVHDWFLKSTYLVRFHLILRLPVCVCGIWFGVLSDST